MRSNFGRGYQEEQFCEIILNLAQLFRRRCVLKIFHIWSSGCPYVQRSGTICAFLVECTHGMYISYSYQKNARAYTFERKRIVDSI